MIISRTPIRLSLIGGSTDYKSWSQKNGGLVVGGAINKYVYLSVRRLPPYHDFKTRLMYSSIETVKENKDIQHLAVKATLKHLDMEKDGLEIAHLSDVPSRSGTGSSSAFVVGLLNALHALKGDFVPPEELTSEACYIEQDLLKETVGCQDQAFAAHGGLNYINFKQDGEIGVFPLGLDSLKVRCLEESLMLLFTGVSRTASTIASSYAPGLAQRVKEQWAMMHLAREGLDAVRRMDIVKLGFVIDQSWRIKRKLSDKVSTPEIDSLYAAARVGGAFGGKLIGAGGGGCLLLVVPPEKRERVRAMVPDLIEIPFRFDFDGSKIIYAKDEHA